nr:PREDICTED: cytochrome P450 1A1-like [Latimeria chalumnae]|eukprot:XP_006006360.1 PREDICTED: cytochrome P450 1A1-like [Latimeria chalumnae]
MIPRVFTGERTFISASDVTVALFAIVVILFAIKKRRNNHQDIKVPPGPMSWPIIGNMLQMGEYPHISFTKLREKYGNVYQIKLGSLTVVVLSGIDTIKQALVRQGESFAGRPDLFTFSLIGNGASMTFGEKYGQCWTLHKKIAKNALRTFSQTEAQNSTCSCLLEEHICSETTELVKLLVELSKKEEAFDPIDGLTSSVANVICALCFGRRYDHSDKEFLTLVQINHEVMRAFGSGNAADFFPIFRYLPSPTLRHLIQFIKRMNNFVARNIEEHYNTYDKNCIRDITDALIALCEGRTIEHESMVLSNEQVVSTVNDIFGAGFDTISTGLHWCLLYLIHYPEIQTNIQQEIDEKIGSSRLPRFDDKVSMPYTEAFINEVFRHTSYVPLTIPHCTTKNTIFNGYFIPKDTCVFINQYQVNHDEALWKDPHLFSPERFLDANGQINKDLTEKVMIFGMGKRRCLGDNFARIEIFIFLTTLLHQLNIENPSGQILDLSPNYGLTMKPKHYKITVCQRTG